MIIGWLFSLLTFPGVVLHEFAHKQFCDLFHVRVYKVSYFKIGTTVGEVSHAAPERYSHMFWISMGPLIINTLVGVLASAIAFQVTGVTLGWQIFLLWLSFSAGVNAFPSDQDTDNIIEASRKPLRFIDFLTLGILFRYFSLLIVYPVKWANEARFLWLIYALLVVGLGWFL